MQSNASTTREYLRSLPEDRKEPVEKLRNVIIENLPEGFQEEMAYGMLAYVVPHKSYPAGYHCNPKQPLPFMNLASQKKYIAVYHMGLYADKKLQDWFTGAYRDRLDKKPDMGKSCIRFNNIKSIPYDLIGELASKMTPEDWISLYEKQVKK
ncbi:DUF1801 domain-containing protein [Salinimicrobium sp. GXAS 041]|uniref:DUF1801 domain-containing protein n=1 Tax=Salinimicrobium sp. GXAS 041 TaxID=3400806 RepID=UPI003C74A495